MSTTITSRSQIPNSPFYVLSNDTFMSGWGGAQGKTNTIILLARDHKEAEIIAENARQRTDQERVRIVSNKPRLQRHVVYSLMTRKEASRWYEEGGFRRDDLSGGLGRIGTIKAHPGPHSLIRNYVQSIIEMKAAEHDATMYESRRDESRARRRWRDARRTGDYVKNLHIEMTSDQRKEAKRLLSALDEGYNISWLSDDLSGGLEGMVSR